MTDNTYSQEGHASDSSIVNQIQGDGNSITIAVGGGRLVLNRLHHNKRPPKTVLEFLRTDIRATTLVGRAGDLENIMKWTDSAAPVGIHCIVGPAGAGKTRLAVEACEIAEDRGWLAGFVPSTELERFHKTESLLNWEIGRDALLVIDYASTSLPVLKDWFSSLAQQRDSMAGGRLRILLLERYAHPDLGWWADLRRRESRDRAGPIDLIGNAQPHELRLAITYRRQMVSEAMDCAFRVLGCLTQQHQLPPEGVDPRLDKLLNSNRVDAEPLFLMMAAIYTGMHGAAAALSLSREELSREMAEIEIARIEKYAKERGYGDRGTFLKHLVSCITLQNGCPRTKLKDLVLEEATSLNASLGPNTAALIQDVWEIMASGNAPVSSKQNIEALQPDIIGEALILLVFRMSLFEPNSSRQAVLRAYRRKPSGTLGTLIRCAQDLSAGDKNHLAVQWLYGLAESSDLQSLMLIYNLLPHHTLVLSDFAVMVTTLIVTALRERQSDSHFAAAPKLAGILNDLSNRLHDAGHHEESLKASSEAKSLYEKLAVSDPETYKPLLAMSLCNCASDLSNMGFYHDALIAINQGLRR